MRKQCAYCGRYFISDRRAGLKQKSCGRPECRKKRKQEAQRRWLDGNEGYFRGRYEDVKAWRERKKESSVGAMIQDEIPPSKPMRKYVLLIPEDKTGMIQDTIILQKVNGITFAAHGG